MKYWLIFLFSTTLCYGQTALRGIVMYENEPFPGAHIAIDGRQEGAVTDSEGRFELSVAESDSVTVIISAVGFQKEIRTLHPANFSSELKIELREDVLALEQVVVSASRKAEKIGVAPVLVSSLAPRILENTQALSLAEGLNFTPGLRVENNCQNCGFTQLRMNGLDGAYSQILINSRPVFSALAGVYGLEMIPPNMIDRIEVVRGGGSALNGANAIAGTVNIITKTPEKNYFQSNMNQSLISGEASDRVISVNGSTVSKNHKSGISFYGFQRNRDPWDANDDGFSEITQLEQMTGGLDAFYRPSENALWRLGIYGMNEYRRGGSDFDREPHQSQIAEELEHHIFGMNASFEKHTPKKNQKSSAYFSIQSVQRDSYYGGGGRVISPGDSITESDLIALNAYGQSTDFSLNSGWQWAKSSTDEKWSLISGVEYRLNDVLDQMPGYKRFWNQTVQQTGLYAELSFQPKSRLSISGGGRLDYTAISGDYRLANEALTEERDFLIPVPRITVRYLIDEKWTARTSFGTGYRTPQAFDEDLHVQTVGGAPQFIVFANDLEAETSHSFSASLQKQSSSPNRQESLTLEAFYTVLNNPFITLNPQPNDNGYSVVTKSNGSGMRVYGVNMEYNYALGSNWVIQSGLTLQNALYNTPEVVWEGADDIVTTKRVLRTPNIYGFGSLVYDAIENWQFSLTSVYTGRMITPHIIDPETEQTRLVNTRDFVEINAKVRYSISLQNKSTLELEGGVQNIFNAYQSDFDRGPFRDAGYIYGPNRPRTFFVGLRFKTDRL